MDNSGISLSVLNKKGDFTALEGIPFFEESKTEKSEGPLDSTRVGFCVEHVGPVFEPTGSLWAGVGRNRPCSSLVSLSLLVSGGSGGRTRARPDTATCLLNLIRSTLVLSWCLSLVSLNDISHKLLSSAFFPDERQSYQTIWTKAEVLGERDKKSLVFGPTNALAYNKSNCKFYTERILSRFLCGIIFFACFQAF